MHLGDDDALGAIHDECAVIGHQRHVAHVNGLLLDVADGLRASIFIEIPDDQAQDHLQRGGIGHAALDAFLDVVFRLFQLVMDELEPAAAGEIVDREDRFENFLDAGMGAGIGLDVHLQERVIAGALHVDQVGHRCATSGIRPKLLRMRLRPVKEPLPNHSLRSSATPIPT